MSYGIRLIAGMLAFMLIAIGAPAFAQEKMPLRVHIFPGAYTSMSVYVAQEKGFYDKHGLTVELVPAQSSSAAIAAMLGGSIDVVESGADLVLSNISKGIDLKYLMANETKNYVTLIVSPSVELPNRDKGYPEVFNDLKGKRFGVNAIGATLHLAAVMMLKEAGLTPEDVEFAATGTAANTLAAWQAGTVDVQLTFPPVPQLMSKLGLAETVMILADDGPDSLKFQNLYSGWLTSQANIDSKKEAIDAFIAAMKESIDWIRDPANESQLLELAAKNTPISILPEGNEEVLNEMVREYNRYWGYEIGRQTVAQWNDYAMKNGLITETIPFEKVVYEGAPTCGDNCN
ncbi:MAG: hypothetical protein BroJett030_23790 [Alphaproteobacteria bacterium]|nr:MAG: hypothetical protein BroJett030_23790 [Alphaproteobacteria bacterium]